MTCKKCNVGTPRERKLFEAYKKESKALSTGKTEQQAMTDAGLILDTPISEQSFLEKDDNDNKRLLTD